MLLLQVIDSKAFLVQLVRDALVCFGTVDHLAAPHVIVHDVFQNRPERLFFQFVLICLAVKYELMKCMFLDGIEVNLV